MSIGDPVAASVQGYYRLPVHLSMGDSRQDKVYYITADGQQVFGGPLWSLNSNPFLENLKNLPTDGQVFGPADAKVTIVVFSDFQCPYCREFARTLRDNIPQKYPRDVRVVFKDFPMDALHPWARAAAEAAHCIGDGRTEAFWSFHDWIFQHQQEVTAANLREKTIGYAKEHGLDSAAVATCLDSHAAKAEVEKGQEEGRALQVEQTPTFYLNGRSVPGALPWNTLDTLIQMELNRPASIPGSDPKR